MSGLLYDTGALLSAERADPVLWSRHKRVLDRGLAPVVLAVVLAQAWRGGPQPNLSRLLRGCLIVAVDEEMAGAAGRACARSGTSDVVDSLVVVAALRRRAAVVTSDPDDLKEIASALGQELPLLVA